MALFVMHRGEPEIPAWSLEREARPAMLGVSSRL
jgi:hypothetical protein